jgi:hypothetical protein
MRFGSELKRSAFTVFNGLISGHIIKCLLEYVKGCCMHSSKALFWSIPVVVILGAIGIILLFGSQGTLSADNTKKSKSIRKESKQSVIQAKSPKSDKVIKKKKWLGEKIYYEDFQTGIEDWRTAEQGSSLFNATLSQIDKGALIQIIPGKPYGKVMSPKEPILIDINPNLEIEMEFGKMNASECKIELMEAVEPFKTYVVFEKIHKAGLYSANIQRETLLDGKKELWLQIWIGSSNDSETKKGAELRSVCIYDRSTERKK